METREMDLQSEGVSFLLPSAVACKASSSEIESSLDKLSEVVSVFIENRSDSFLKTEEKVQQYIHDQLVTLKNEEEQYANMYQGLQKQIAECELQLKEIEYSYFDYRKRIAVEQDINVKLQDELSSQKIEEGKLKERFQKTYNLYSTVVQWYEKYLNIHIRLDENNSAIIIFHFKKDKSIYSDMPFVKLQMLDGSDFKLLDVHKDIQEGKENLQKVYSCRDLRVLINNIHKELRNLKMFWN